MATAERYHWYVAATGAGNRVGDHHGAQGCCGPFAEVDGLRERLASGM